MPNTNERDASAVLVADSTIYVLNAQGYNRWSANVQPGQDDDGKRISDEECKSIARALAATAPNAGAPLAEGWTLVPVVPTEKMIGEGSCAQSLPGPHYISESAAKACWKYMLAAAPAQQAGAPTQERPHALGCTVSVDVSTGDHDAGHRIFAKVGSMQQEANGDWTLLAEETSRNFAASTVAGTALPLAPSEAVEPGDRILLEVIRRGQIEDGLHPTCGYIQALDRAIARVATPQQATLPAREPDAQRYCNKCGYVGPYTQHRRPDGIAPCQYLSAPAQPQADAAEPVALTDEERQQLADTIAEFVDTEQTMTDYPVLLDWAARGLLECTHFVPTEAGRAAAAQAPGARGEQA